MAPAPSGSACIVTPRANNIRGLAAVAVAMLRSTEVDDYSWRFEHDLIPETCVIMSADRYGYPCRGFHFLQGEPCAEPATDMTETATAVSATADLQA